MSMQEFHIAPANLAATVAQREKKAFHYVVLVGAGASLVISGWSLALGYYQMMLLMPAFAAALAILYRRNTRVERQKGEKLHYVVTDDSITAAGDGHPLTLFRGEVTSVERNRRGAIILRTGKLMRFMYIRPDVENFATLIQMVSEWTPVVERETKWIELWPRISIVIALMMAPLAASVCLSESRWVVIPGGLLLIAIVILALVTVYHQKGTILHKSVAWVCLLSCVGLLNKIVGM